LVYATRFSDDGGHRTAVFLSGNDPLVKVLRYALESKVFVQDMHGFLMQYGGNSKRSPEEHIWVYDEAQRAWDSTRVSEKRGHAASEPEDFLRIGERMKGWAMMVGLIGEGQEIHLGEEAGIEQWNTALDAMHGHWTVHCPRKCAGCTFTEPRWQIALSEIGTERSIGVTVEPFFGEITSITE
jgi:hypothetical protein